MPAWAPLAARTRLSVRAQPAAHARQPAHAPPAARARPPAHAPPAACARPPAHAPQAASTHPAATAQTAARRTMPHRTPVLPAAALPVDIQAAAREADACVYNALHAQRASPGRGRPWCQHYTITSGQAVCVRRSASPCTGERCAGLRRLFVPARPLECAATSAPIFLSTLASFASVRFAPPPLHTDCCRRSAAWGAAACSGRARSICRPASWPHPAVTPVCIVSRVR